MKEIPRNSSFEIGNEWMNDWMNEWMTLQDRYRAARAAKNTRSQLPWDHPLPSLVPDHIFLLITQPLLIHPCLPLQPKRIVSLPNIIFSKSSLLARSKYEENTCPQLPWDHPLPSYSPRSPPSIWNNNAINNLKSGTKYARKNLFTSPFRSSTPFLFTHVSPFNL